MFLEGVSDELLYGDCVPELKQRRIIFSVGAKLIGLIAVLLLSSLVSLVWLSTRMFIEDNTALIQQMNADTASNLSTQMRELFNYLTEKMRFVGAVLLNDTSEPDIKEQLTQSFFQGDKNFLAVYLHRSGEGGVFTLASKATSPDMATMSDPDGEKLLASLLADKEFSLANVRNGDAQVASLELPDGSSAIAISTPLTQAGGSFSHTITIVVKQTKFSKAFGESDIVNSFMVDHKGRLLAHTDAARVAARENVSNLEIVKHLLEGKFNNGQTRYIDPQSGEARLGAFRVVGFGGLGVIAEVPEAKAFEAAHRVEYRSIMLAFAVLCLSFLAGYLYSGSITWPIRQLMEASRRVSEGDFTIELRPKGHDEIAHLSLAFNDMAKGLAERDKVKDVFNRFHNKEVADKLLSGEVKLGGERKEATIFFSDVRGFTAMSEALEPEQVVEMLNEYMTRMVAIIRAHGGIVDKYVGDAIMALWGVPLEGPNDSVNAIKASLAMRMELSKLNELRISRGQGVLKIGMGVNTGPVIAGNIGSIEKMEYTVIGDSVNLASRIESMTKEYGTDLLISRSIYDNVKANFVFENCKSAKVKGKSEAIEIFKVRGYIDENGQQVILDTPYSSYATEKSDKAVHDEPAHAGEPEVSEVEETTGLIFEATSEIHAPPRPEVPPRPHAMPPPPPPGVSMPPPPKGLPALAVVAIPRESDIPPEPTKKTVIPPPFKGPKIAA